MSYTDIKLPHFDVNETEATITEIRADNKQKVEKGQIIFIAENTKASEEIQAPEEGYILLLCKKYGVKKMGESLALIFPSAEELERFDLHSLQPEEQAYDVPINATRKAVEMAESLHVNLAELAAFKGDSVIRVKDVQEFFENRNKSSAGSTDTGRVFRYDRERVVIIGAGKGAEVVIDILLDDPDKDIIGLVDDNRKEMTVYPYPVLDCTVRDFAEQTDKNRYDTVIISLGATLNSMILRRQIFEDYRQKGIHFTNAIAKSIQIRRGVRMGTGNIIGDGCYIGTMTQIGDNNSVSYGVCLGHHNILGDSNLVGPGVCTSGSVEIGSGCILPAGVITGNRLKIGNRVVVPAGYAITRSMADDTVIRQKNHE